MYTYMYMHTCYHYISYFRYKAQLTAAKALALEAGLAEDGPYDATDVDKIAQMLAPRGYSINLWRFQDGIPFLSTRGREGANHQINILLHEGHAALVLLMPSFLDSRNYCSSCCEAYSNDSRHRCQYRCEACLRPGGPCKRDPGNYIECQDCLCWFRGQSCLANHRTTSQAVDQGSPAKSLCEKRRICPECRGLITSQTEHHCVGEHQCTRCRTWYSDDDDDPHGCYAKPIDEETFNGPPELTVYADMETFCTKVCVCGCVCVCGGILTIIPIRFRTRTKGVRRPWPSMSHA